MCGVIAFVGGPVPERAEALCRLAHRGPDATGSLELPGVWLGHQRLAILDPTPAANQPMGLGPSGPWLTYNGEIYNHLKLRRNGRAFRTGSDTETILALWDDQGVESLPRLDGMFAFVLVERNGRVVCARDRAGVKPLYYAPTSKGMWLSSEIKAIPGVIGGTTPEPARLLEYLRYESIAGVRTPFRGIHVLPPGSHLIVPAPGNPPVIEQFHDMLGSISAADYERASRLNWTEARDNLDGVLSGAVESQMLSDVPIGTLCSGGLDSSLVTAIVHRRDPTVQIFSVDFTMPAFSERAYIEAVTRHLGIRVQYVVLDRETFLSDLVDCIYHNDYPLSHANSVGVYRVSRLAHANGVKVLLTGEGADELFGGYTSYAYLARRLAWGRRLAVLPAGFRRRLRAALAPPPVAKEDVILRSSEAEWAGAAHGHLERAGIRNRALHSWDFVKDPVERQVLATMSADLLEYLQPILQREDRMGMMAGVESRVPFLSNDVLRWTASLPLGFRIRAGEGKPLLKACAERYLPRAIVRRPKAGFAVPQRAWLQLKSTDFFRGGFVEEVFGGSLVREAGAIPPGLLFPFLNLEIWGRIFVRGEDRGVLTERLLHESAGIDTPAATRALRARAAAPVIF